MVLTSQQKFDIMAWCTERSLKVCPVCSANALTIADDVYTVLVYHPVTGVEKSAPAFPQVVIVCTNCAHILNFSATVMGITQPLAPRP